MDTEDLYILFRNGVKYDILRIYQGHDGLLFEIEGRSEQVNQDVITPLMEEFHEEANLEKKDNVVTLKLIDGGKSDGGSNWLMGLAEKTVFLVRHRPNPQAAAAMPRWMLGQFILSKKFEKSALLLNNLNGEQLVFVIPEQFVQDYYLHEVLYDPNTMPPIVSLQEQETEVEDE